MIGRRLARKTARGNEAVTVADSRVTGSAINVVALASSFQNFFGHRKRHVVTGAVANLAGIEIRVLAQLAARHRAFDGWTLGALVGEKVAAGKRILPGWTCMSRRQPVSSTIAASRPAAKIGRRRSMLAGYLRNRAWPQGLAESPACRPHRTWDRKKTRSGRSGLWTPGQSAAH